jgi:hypothetical protein
VTFLADLLYGALVGVPVAFAAVTLHPGPFRRADPVAGTLVVVAAWVVGDLVGAAVVARGRAGGGS